MDLRAFAPRADYDKAEGEVAVDGCTFDIGTALKAGKGVIVVHATDDTLVAVLEAYPVLKDTKVPAKPAVVVSPYERHTVEHLRHLASLYDVEGAGGLSRTDLVEKLTALHDATPEVAAAADQPAETAKTTAGADA